MAQTNAVGPQLLEDVSDIITNNDGFLYSFETQDIAAVTDLKQPTLLADFVYTCDSFDPVIGRCPSQFQPAGLMTDKGVLHILRRFDSSWGLFWASLNPPGDGE